MYKTEIPTIQWIIYDILGNIGWIAYYISLGLCFQITPEFMQYWGLAAILLLAIIPALFMFIGIVELINERINKLNRLLPKIRLYRGFGALTLGGILGAIITLIGIIYAGIVANGTDISLLYVLFIGSSLCAIFAGLCFKNYKRI